MHDHYVSNLFLFSPDGEIHRQATSVRQLTEWGMRGLQGSFLRRNDRILYEERGVGRTTIREMYALYILVTSKPEFLSYVHSISTALEYGVRVYQPTGVYEDIIPVGDLRRKF